MNLQNIQILFLLLDSVIMLAPWRIVTKTAERIRYAVGRGLVQSLAIVAVVCTFLYVFPPVSLFGAILSAGDFNSAMLSHLRIGNPLISITLFGCYLGVLLWGGLWLWRRSPRAFMPLWSGFCLTDC
jgi:hypothetical protein